MIIDGTNLIMGRMANIIAKKALEGETVIVVNCENVIITGPKLSLFAHFKERSDKGDPYHGPIYPKMADRIVRRSVRGMLSYKKPRGAAAYNRVMCYLGVPEKYANEKFETIESANAKKLKTLNYAKLKDISHYLKNKE